jgi:hypothetical protein
MKRVLIAVMLAVMSISCLGQAQFKRDSQSAASGVTLKFQNPQGLPSQTFEYVISGSPATASIVLSGCMSGNTCDVLETSTSTVSTNRTYSVAYDYYTVAPTFTGGSSPAVRVNASFATGTPTNSNVPAIKDPCASPNSVHLSAPISFSTATTVAVVAPVANKTAYVCALSLAITSGTTPTIVFNTGTGATCGTGTVALTGVMSLPTASGTFLTVGAGHTAFSGILSGGICYTTGGTTPTAAGWVTYVQQ